MAFSINDSVSQCSSFFKLNSHMPQDSWQVDDYDEVKELEEINACQLELSSRFSSQIIASEAIIITMHEGDQEENKIDEYSYRAETLKKLECVFKKPIDKPPKPSKSCCCKNFCRYIISNAIRAMNSYELPEEFKQYYRWWQRTFTGFQQLREHLIIHDADCQETKTRKLLFQKYLLSFLEERASLYILSSKRKRNIREYLKYKNQISYPLEKQYLAKIPLAATSTLVATASLSKSPFPREIGEGVERDNCAL